MEEERRMGDTIYACRHCRVRIKHGNEDWQTVTMGYFCKIMRYYPSKRVEMGYCNVCQGEVDTQRLRKKGQ